MIADAPTEGAVTGGSPEGMTAGEVAEALARRVAGAALVVLDVVSTSPAIPEGAQWIAVQGRSEGQGSRLVASYVPIKDPRPEAFATRDHRLFAAACADATLDADPLQDTVLLRSGLVRWIGGLPESKPPSSTLRVMRRHADRPHRVEPLRRLRAWLAKDPCHADLLAEVDGDLARLVSVADAS